MWWRDECASLLLRLRLLRFRGAERICSSGVTLAQMVEQCIAYPCSGETNFKVAEAATVVQRLQDRYATAAAVAIDHADGLSVGFAEWRFNVRSSNTGLLLRLNIETRATRPACRKDGGDRVAYHRIALGCLGHPQGQRLPMNHSWRIRRTFLPVDSSGRARKAVRHPLCAD